MTANTADVFNLDEYRRTEGGMYVPTMTESHSVDVAEPVEPDEQEQANTTGRTRSPAVALLDRRSRVASAKSSIEDPGVISRRSANATAAAREELADDPRAEAFGNRRARFWLLLMAAVGIALGVGISASTAQTTITTFMGWAVNSVAGLAAYGADPALGLVLFATLGARVLASARGVAIPERARRALNGIETVLFGLVALLNAGPSLGRLVADVGTGAWERIGPDFMVLVIHCLGPVLVATGVFGIPYMALILAEVSTATNAKRAAAERGVTPPACSENAPASSSASNPAAPSREDEITAELSELLAAGRWRENVAVPPIRRHFGCGVEIARNVRDRVAA